MASEIENNNAITDANTLLNGTTITGNFTGQADVDYFKVDVNKGETITLDFDWNATSSLWPNNYAGQLSIQVFNSATDLIVSKTPIGYSNNPYKIGHTGQKISFSTGANETGSYYIRLSNNISSMDTLDAGYSMTVNSQTTSQMYELEGNNSTSNSNIISSEKSVIGQLSSANDVDIYKIDIPKLKRKGIDGEATITVNNYTNIPDQHGIEITLSNGNIIYLRAETPGGQSPSDRSGNTIYYRPYESNNTTADNIYTALNSQSEFTVSNPEANVVKVVESSPSPNSYPMLEINQFWVNNPNHNYPNLAVTSPKGYPDVVIITSEYAGANQILKIKDSNGSVLKVKDSDGSLKDSLAFSLTNTTASFDILQSGDYFLEVSGAGSLDDYKIEVKLPKDQPNQENITLGTTFATATHLGKISDLDEKWITFDPNGVSRGFFKVENDLTFENYDRLFLRILGDNNDNYGVRFYDSSGANLSAWLSTSKGKIDFGIKSQHQAKTGEIYYSSNNAVVEIYETTGKAITSDLKMIAQHFSPKTLSSASSLSDSGQYTVPSGAQIYTGESLYSLINSDGLKLAVSKSQPVVIVLKQDISKVVWATKLSDLTKSSNIFFGFQGFDAEGAKKVKIKAYDKVTGLSLDVASASGDVTDLSATGAHALISTYAAGSNDIVVEITTEESGYTNGWFIVEPSVEYSGTTTTSGNLYPDIYQIGLSKNSYFGSLGPDNITGYGDDSIISGWTGNDLISTGTSSVSEYNGTDISLADNIFVFPYTGNDIINIERDLNDFELLYSGIHYPNEALEVGYDNALGKYMVKGETFADLINVNSGVKLDNFSVVVGARDTKTLPITISSKGAPTSNKFLAMYESSPDLWESGRVPDKFVGDTNTYDMVMVEATTTDLSAYKDVTVGINSDATGFKVSTKLTSGSTSEILNFSNVEALIVGDGNDTIELGLDTDYLQSWGGNDSITTSSSPNIVMAGKGDDTFTLGSQSFWGLDSEAWNINQDKTIFYKVPINGKTKYEDMIFGEEGTDTLNMLGSSSDAFFLHDVISGHAKAGQMSSLTLQTLKKARIEGIETINAGNADDVIDLTSPDFTGTFNIKINGDAGHDVLWGNKGDDKLNGGDGDDLLFGGEGKDILTGGKGKDVFEFSAEKSAMQYPFVQDTIIDYNKSEGDLIRFYVQTNDTQNFTQSNLHPAKFIWKTSEGDLTIFFPGDKVNSLNDLNIEFVEVPTEKVDRYVVHDSTNGWSLANLVGTKENDTLTGSSAIDKIFAGIGDDIITGGGGQDIIYAGSDNDLIKIGSSGVKFVNGGAGTDTLSITSDRDGSGNLIHFDASNLVGIEVIDISQCDAGAKVSVGAYKNDINPTARTGYADKKNVMTLKGDTQKSQKVELKSLSNSWIKESDTVYKYFDGSENYYLLLEGLTVA